MIKGFSMLEILVVLVLMFVLVSMVVSQVTETNRFSQKVIGNQQRLESIFCAVDSIRSDLIKCGMRLQEAASTFGFPTFECSDQSFKVLYGVGEEAVKTPCWAGDTAIDMDRNDFFSKQMIKDCV